MNERLKEIERQLMELQNEKDKLLAAHKLKAQALQTELDLMAAREKLEQMSEKERAMLIHTISPQGIPSAEKFGNV